MERIVGILKRARNEIARDLQIDPSVLAPKHVLTSIAESKPANIEQLSRIEAMRRWQVEVAGREFISAL